MTQLSQRAFAVKKLTEAGRITNGDFLAQFQHFTGRNRLTDAWMKAYWSARGFEIHHFFGDSWEQNGWELKPIPEPMPAPESPADALLGGIPSVPHISNRHQNQLPL